MMMYFHRGKQNDTRMIEWKTSWKLDLFFFAIFESMFSFFRKFQCLIHFYVQKSIDGWCRENWHAMIHESEKIICEGWLHHCSWRMFFFFRDGANCQGVRKTRAKQGRKKNKARRATKASFGDKETGNANNKVRVQRNKVGDVGVDWPPNHFFLDSTFRYFCPFSWRCPKAGKAPMAMLASCAGYTAMAVPLLGLKEDGLIAKRKHLCLYWTYWILVAILVPGMVKNNE